MQNPVESRKEPAEAEDPADEEGVTALFRAKKERSVKKPPDKERHARLEGRKGERRHGAREKR